MANAVLKSKLTLSDILRETCDVANAVLSPKPLKKTHVGAIKEDKNYRVGIFHQSYPSKSLSKRAYALKSITTEKHVGGDPFFRFYRRNLEKRIFHDALNELKN
jgi:hypothetical protein